MRSQDDIDTAPVIFWEGTRVEFQSTTAAPGERVELVLEPALPMDGPTLFMSLDPRDDQVVVEAITCGRIAVVVQESAAENYRFGRRLSSIVTTDDSLKILIANRGARSVKIGASLVVSEESPGAFVYLFTFKHGFYERLGFSKETLSMRKV